MRRYIRGLLAAALLGSTTACLDLNVINNNLPDMERALGEPADVEQVIASAFRIWYNQLHGYANVTQVYPLLADETTNTTLVVSVQWSGEPRQPLINDPLVSQVWVPRHPWDNFSECAANTNDGLRQIVRDNMIIRTIDPGQDSTTDNTDRAYFFAKFFQGTCLGYLALTMDRFAPATEDTDFAPSPLDWEKANIKPWTEGLPLAIKSLEQAIARGESGGDWILPESWIPGTAYTRDQMTQLAHTMLARILVYSARTPAERAAVDWDKVQYHAERGLTYDWGPVLASGVITDGSYLVRITPGTGTTGAGSVQRADPHLLGPADQSGAYKAWLEADIEDRNRFDIVTPDRRVTGATPTTSGAYFRYRPNNNGVSNTALGTYNFSAYDWHRRLNYGNFTSTTGQFVLASADENRLYLAEALLRKGNLQGAADLINVTRTRPVKVGTNTAVPNLPPVTTAGAPMDANGHCVPRKVLTEAQRRNPANADQCGDLMDALMWERQVELYGQNPMRAWMDRRGLGQMQVGTLLHMPISARYLPSLGIPFYTFGGIGNPGSAE